MSMEYIRKTYGVPAKRGGRVLCNTLGGWREGTIVSATHYVIVRIDSRPNVKLRFHPTDSENLIYR